MRRKLITPAVAIALVAALCGFVGRVIPAATAKVQEPADVYKTKCVACHGKKAEKKFDTSLSDDQLVEVVLKGKKAEKPPNMPAYAEKGVTADQAKALVAYMKQLKATP